MVDTLVYILPQILLVKSPMLKSIEDGFVWSSSGRTKKAKMLLADIDIAVLNFAATVSDCQ